MAVTPVRNRGWVIIGALALAGGCVALPPSDPSPAKDASAKSGHVSTAMREMIAAAAAGSASTPAPAPPPEVPADAPEIAREFRGVWVASVGNMDWPSRPGLSVERQQAELIRILDRAAQLGLNAVLFQVRPAADALYASPYEPWSEYLTGQMGRAPEPFYDPLEFAVAEAHRRGLELHAWFNPFRARYAGAKSPAAATHLSRARPELVRRYGTHLWMDPSEPEVQDHSLRVILDVVRRYDIDGVHIDDYFYPYREYSKGKLIQFPDDANYARYRQRGGHLGRSDWRRQNVDRFVERLYTEIKREKRRVKFGISPFGIWRPGYPAQITGLDAYEEIFADARKWLNNGWLDYFTPQLYWPIRQHAQSFPVLLDWWAAENREGRHLWPGAFSDRVGSGRWPASEILEQIQVTRERPTATGHVLFRMSSLKGSNDLAQRLASESYVQPAIVPASPWLHSAAPERPRVAVVERNPTRTVLSLVPVGEEEVFLWTLRARTESGWTTQVVPGSTRRAWLDGSPEQIVVTPIGRTGNEGPPIVIAP